MESAGPSSDRSITSNKEDGLEEQPNNNNVVEFENIPFPEASVLAARTTRSRAKSAAFRSSMFRGSVVSEGGTLVKALGEDIYSLMFTARGRGPAFFFAICVFVVQLTILVLIFIDLVNFTKDPPKASNGLVNRLSIPAGTPTTLSVAQFFGVALTISFTSAQGDLIKGFEHLVNGYDKELCKQNPSANRLKYVMAGVFQSAVGILMTSNLFILLMQSTEVLGMCLNFAALHFVQDIDDVAFTVASMGLVGQVIQDECLGVGDIMIAVRTRNRTWRLRRIYMFFLVVVLYSMYFAIKLQQWNGKFRCTTIFVQFGDAYFPDLAYYSGRFHSSTSISKRVNGRHFFVDETETVQLHYDSTESAWVFQYIDAPDGTYLIKSIATDSFDVTTLSANTWYANTPDGVNAVEWIALGCNECNQDTCNPEYGTCEDDACVCNEGRLGLNCGEAPPECTFFGLDLRTKAGLANIEGASFFFDNEFTATEIVVGNRLVYVAVNYVEYRPDDSNFSETPAFMIFTGRRWIIFEMDLTFVYFWLNHDPQATGLSHTSLELLRNSTQAPLFFSSPVDYGTPSDSFDPSTVGWVFAVEDDTPDAVLSYRPSDADPVDAQLLCTNCAVTKGCLHDGRCDTERFAEGIGVCACTPFYEGFQCEYRYSCSEIGCQAGGVCDPLIGRCRDCIPGYSGNLCHSPVSAKVKEDPYFCSSPKPRIGGCQNKQKCDPFALKCICEEPFYGEFCELSRQPNCTAPENSCPNEGVCDESYHIPSCRCLDPDQCLDDLANTTGRFLGAEVSEAYWG